MGLGADRRDAARLRMEGSEVGVGGEGEVVAPPLLLAPPYDQRSDGVGRRQQLPGVRHNDRCVAPASCHESSREAETD